MSDPSPPRGRAGFSLGQLIHHRRFDYRGVVFDVDPVFLGTEEWYEQMATSQPPKDKPWYHVLVDGLPQMTYVAERNLEPDDDGGPIRHPMIERLFKGFENGAYVLRTGSN